MQDIDRIVDRLYQLAEEQHLNVRGVTKYGDQIRRRDEITSLKAKLKPFVHPGTTEDSCFQFIETTLKLENFMLNVPLGVQVVPQNRIKQNTYSNDGKSETRLYFCPHFKVYDNDSISVVVALTPPDYMQPLHAHFMTDEYTLSLSDGMEMLGRKGRFNRTMDVPRGYISVIPKGLTHAVINPNPIGHAPNISVKLPESLDDRYNIHRRSYCQIVDDARTITPTIEKTKSFRVVTHEVSDLGYTYRVELVDFIKGNPMQVTPKNQTEVYLVTQGCFSINGRSPHKHAYTWSLIIVDPDETAEIIPKHSSQLNSLYRVSLVQSPKSRL